MFKKGKKFLLFVRRPFNVPRAMSLYNCNVNVIFEI